MIARTLHCAEFTVNSIRGFPRLSDAALIDGVEISKIRRMRLQELIDTKYGGVQAEFAKKAGVNPTQISTALNPSPKNPKYARQIGEKLARKIEVALELPIGWLDGTEDLRQPQPKYLVSPTSILPDVEALENVIAAVETFLEEGDGEPPTPKNKAKAIVLLYDRYAMTGKPDASTVARYLRLVK